MTDIVESLRHSEPTTRMALLAAEEIERLREETLVQSECIETLRGLLRPFAALDQPHNARKADDHPLFAINSAVVTCGDVRRVREALGNE